MHHGMMKGHGMPGVGAPGGAPPAVAPALGAPPAVGTTPRHNKQDAASLARLLRCIRIETGIANEDPGCSEAVTYEGPIQVAMEFPVVHLGSISSIGA